MPRDIPVGNGSLLVGFDADYQIRDLYFPRVGQENHAGGSPCRFGVFASMPDGSGGRIAWTTDPGWTIRRQYLRDTLVSSVSLEHRGLLVGLYCNDAVDFTRNVLVRRIAVSNRGSVDRVIQIVHHQAFNMFGMKLGDTAYYDPELRGVVHYRAKRYLLVSGCVEGKHGVSEYATGTSGFNGAEGTWRDAEDGHLQGNPITQGAVDSTVSIHVEVPAGQERTLYLILAAAESREQLLPLVNDTLAAGPQTLIDRTASYWRLWLGGTRINYGNLPESVVGMFRRSLLVLRTQIDNGGAILAANDSDIMQYSRDTYSYVWPRDGALVADALDLAGFPDVAKAFYRFCARVISPEGYFHHKYNPDGSPASSWHPWVMDGEPSLPIQEDETALVVWGIWRHYARYRDIEFVRPLWIDVVQKAADFMVRHRDPRTHLPLPSYDLWEERWGVHAFTVATVYGGLMAAHHFAVCFGEKTLADRYGTAAREIRDAAARHLWSEQLGRFVRRLVPRKPESVNANDGNGHVSTNATPAAHADSAAAVCEHPTASVYEIDGTVDASLSAVFAFGLFDAEDPRVVATMTAVETRLWVKTPVGGVARYENDSYHRVTNDPAVPGNPWFICTLWLADYLIARASTHASLKAALPILQWCAAHALPSGVLAEQVHPYSNDPISVSPLTWSHATVVATVIKYLERLESLQRCASCGQSVYRLKRRPAGDGESLAGFEGLEFGGEKALPREMLSPVGRFSRTDDRTGEPSRATLSIDQRDCIGCNICVARCDRGVLVMSDGKAMIDLRNLNRCDLDGECVKACPTEVISLRVIPAGEVVRSE